MSRISTKIKNILPKKVVYYYHLKSAILSVLPDLKRRVRDKVFQEAVSSKLERDLSLFYHSIEKGLTMPNPKPNFGQLVINKLCHTIDQCQELNIKYNSIEFNQSLSVLQEYLEFHDLHGFEIDQEFEKKIKSILEKNPSPNGIKQIRISKDEYFSESQNSFDKFCMSRYSVRHYTDEIIPIETFYNCIKLAQKSPSFCNRQPTRVHIIQDKTTQKKILELQNGNRGFGHLASALIVITSDISVTKDIHERNENHLNGGMFIMSLLNALHFYKIGACSLNWSVDEIREQKLRNILKLQDNEIALMIISCGMIPENIAIAASPRKTFEEITTIH